MGSKEIQDAPSHTSPSSVRSWLKRLTDYGRIAQNPDGKYSLSQVELQRRDLLHQLSYRSISRSPRGLEQQIRILPSAGGSSGSGSYSIEPAINADSQLWQTPVRQDQPTGTRQASASSRRLWNCPSHAPVTPLRTNDTRGPEPRTDLGGSGLLGAAMPGVKPSPGPNASL